MRFSIDNQPAEVDWLVHSADDWWLYFTVKLGGVAQDVSSWTFAGTITESRNSGIVIAELEWDVSEAAMGRVGYGLNNPATVLARQTAWYEVELKNSKRQTFQHGILDIQFDHSELP